MYRDPGKTIYNLYMISFSSQVLNLLSTKLPYLFILQIFVLFCIIKWIKIKWILVYVPICEWLVVVPTKFNLPTKKKLSQKEGIESKITKRTNTEEKWKQKVLIKCQKHNLVLIKRMKNNCHVPDFVQAFSNVENVD